MDTPFTSCGFVDPGHLTKANGMTALRTSLLLLLLITSTLCSSGSKRAAFHDDFTDRKKRKVVTSEPSVSDDMPVCAPSASESSDSSRTSASAVMLQSSTLEFSDALAACSSGSTRSSPTTSSSELASITGNSSSSSSDDVEDAVSATESGLSAQAGAAKESEDCLDESVFVFNESSLTGLLLHPSEQLPVNVRQPSSSNASSSAAASDNFQPGISQASSSVAASDDLDNPKAWELEPCGMEPEEMSLRLNFEHIWDLFERTFARSRPSNLTALWNVGLDWPTTDGQPPRKRNLSVPVLTMREFLLKLVLSTTVTESELKHARMLIAGGLDVDKPVYSIDGSSFGSFLHLAVEAYIPSTTTARVIKLLLESKANVNQFNSNGETPLYVAISRGHVDVVELLLQNGADLKLRVQKWGCPSPLAIAIYHNQMGVFKYLVANRLADVNEIDPMGRHVLHMIINKKNYEAFAFLLSSSKLRVNRQVLRMILTLCNSVEMHPILHLFCRCCVARLQDEPEKLGLIFLLCIRLGCQRAVTIFLQLGLNPSLPVMHETKPITPIAFACLWNQVDILRIFRSCGHSLTAEASNGRTPITYTTINGAIDAFRFLAELENVNVLRALMSELIRADNLVFFESLLELRSDVLESAAVAPTRQFAVNCNADRIGEFLQARFGQQDINRSETA